MRYIKCLLGYHTYLLNGYFNSDDLSKTKYDSISKDYRYSYNVSNEDYKHSLSSVKFKIEYKCINCNKTKRYTNET